MLKELDTPKPVSDERVVEILRDFLDLVFYENVISLIVLAETEEETHRVAHIPDLESGNLMLDLLKTQIESIVYGDVDE